MGKRAGSGLGRWCGRLPAVIVLLALRGVAAGAQQAGGDAAGAGQPLPEIATLMRAVEVNQHVSEAVAKQYAYHSVETMQQTDKHGGAKRTEVRAYDVHWVGDVLVRRLLSKDGRPLSADEQKKEDERVAKEADRARQRRERATAEGKQTGPNGEEEVTVSRLLELGRFSNARRVAVDGRPTIEVDFAGDPAAKTRNRFEGVIRDMEGTVWVDEEDKQLRRVDGRFVRDFKVGGGLLADIRQGKRFTFEQRKVNGEVWLPARAEGVGAVRMLLLLHFDGSGSVVDSDYRRFRATSTILPGIGKVEDGSQPAP